MVLRRKIERRHLVHHTLPPLRERLLVARAALRPERALRAPVALVRRAKEVSYLEVLVAFGRRLN
eukprot:4535601-Prymnesium_polylepis.1